MLNEIIKGESLEDDDEFTRQLHELPRLDQVILSKAYADGLKPTPSPDPDHASLNDLVSRCLSIDPAMRPNFKDIHSELAAML